MKMHDTQFAQSIGICSFHFRCAMSWLWPGIFAVLSPLFFCRASRRFYSGKCEKKKKKNDNDSSVWYDQRYALLRVGGGSIRTNCINSFRWLRQFPLLASFKPPFGRIVPNYSIRRCVHARCVMMRIFFGKSYRFGNIKDTWPEIRGTGAHRTKFESTDREGEKWKNYEEKINRIRMRSSDGVSCVRLCGTFWTE